MTSVQQQRIVIVDFGSQYTQLLARRVRELGVFSELILPVGVSDYLAQHPVSGIILSGGPESLTAVDTPRIPQAVFEANVPLLGVCYGMQAMAQQLGGQVKAAQQHEYGFAQVQVQAAAPLLAGLNDHPQQQQPCLDVWMSHGDQVVALPPGFHRLASTASVETVVMGDVSRHWYGVQFHPEVTHTASGRALLQRFIQDICGCRAQWTQANIIEQAIADIEAKVGDQSVLLALSGGVDSSVAAMLLHRALGDRLQCVFVDTGLLRQQEGDQVMQLFAQHLDVKVDRVNAQQQFLTALAGIDEPEAKRKIIGNTFIRVFEQQARQYAHIDWLAQGTIYPDVIESAQAQQGAHVIKSHHNVGGLPDDMQLKIIEPLRELFKDEVRKIGESLGLPHDLLYRHPFPGPGLAVRILGEIKPAYVAILQQVDHIFIQALRQANLYDQVSQAFAVFLPVKSVGVKGDARCYEYVVSLRAVETVDFMTAQWARLDPEFLAQVSRRIINEVPGVSRVVYDISDKPPATIEWE